MVVEWRKEACRTDWVDMARHTTRRRGGTLVRVWLTSKGMQWAWQRNEEEVRQAGGRTAPVLRRPGRSGRSNLEYGASHAEREVHADGQ